MDHTISVKGGENLSGSFPWSGAGNPNVLFIFCIVIAVIAVVLGVASMFKSNSKEKKKNDKTQSGGAQPLGGATPPAKNYTIDGDMVRLINHLSELYRKTDEYMKN